MLSGDNSILNRAGEARGVTDESNKIELLKIAVLGGYDSTGKLNADSVKENIEKEINEATAIGDGFPLKVIINGETFKIDNKGIVKKYANRDGLKIGDYVNYTYTEKEAYSKDKLGENYTGSANNISNINQESLNWRVLTIYEDGSFDLIAEPTSQTVYFSGATGYNNGVYIMNDICKYLYSNDIHDIEARSVNLEDFEKNMTGTGKRARDEYNKNSTTSPQYGKTNYEKWNTTYENRYYPNIYSRENGSGIMTTNTITNGIKPSDENVLDLTIGNNAYKQASTGGLTSTQTAYYIGLNEDNYGNTGTVLKRSSSTYWVAARFVECIYCSCFGLRAADSDIGGTYMFRSDNFMDGNSFSLRPVVYLDCDINLILSENANNDSLKPHIIDW